VLGLACYSILFGGNPSGFLAFSFFMGAFSARMLTQRLVRVRMRTQYSEISRAPLVVSVNSAVMGISLLLIGLKYVNLTGEFDSVLFDVIGVAMAAVSSVYICALFRPRRFGRKSGR
jgi:hypothetical protein